MIAPVYSSDWVTAHEANWRRLLDPVRRLPDLRGLEIGVYEGRSTEWFLRNICTAPGSRLVSVEPYLDRFRDNYRALQSSGLADRLELHQGFASEILPRISLGKPVFDFAYVDGGKDTDTLIQTSVLVWLALKPGGVLIWDDYEWTNSPGEPPVAKPPKQAIDAFLACHAGKYIEQHRGWQVAIRKL